MNISFPKKSLPALLAEAGTPGEYIYSREAGAMRVVLPDGETVTPGEAAQRFLLRAVLVAGSGRSAPTEQDRTSSTPSAERIRMNTVGELIAHLSEFDPASAVRLAINPDFPFAHTIGDITASDDSGRRTVFIAETGHQEHLPVPAAQALGWLPLTEPPARTRRGPLRVVDEEN